MNIYLVGFMGSGKTTIGKALAARTNKQFIDIDERIVAQQKMPINEIFSVMGEDFFRKTEAQILKETFKTTNAVVATGGGIPCFYNNMDLINQNGISIFLQTSLENILLRTNDNKHTRPLLKNKNNKEIEALLNEREVCYKKSTTTIDTNGLSIDEIVKRIITQVKT